MILEVIAFVAVVIAVILPYLFFEVDRWLIFHGRCDFGNFKIEKGRVFIRKDR